MENNLEILALSFLGVLFLVGMSIIMIDRIEEKRKKKDGRKK
jgi:nitrate reductase gamma subunit